MFVYTKKYKGLPGLLFVLLGWMAMSKTISMKLTDDEELLVDRLLEQGLSKSDIMRESFRAYMEKKCIMVDQVDPDMEDEKKGIGLPKVDWVDQDFDIEKLPDELYDAMYTQINTLEIQPLQEKIIHLNDKISLFNITIADLKEDKAFLKSQNTALMLVKMPLLARIKMWLLNKNNI